MHFKGVKYWERMARQVAKFPQRGIVEELLNNFD